MFCPSNVLYFTVIFNQFLLDIIVCYCVLILSILPFHLHNHICKYIMHIRGRRYYEHALCVRRLITQEFQEAFSHVDALLTPTTISNAPLNTEIEKLGPVESCVYDKHTVPVNLAG